MMLKLFIAVTLVLAACAKPLDHQLDEHWELFKRQHGKQYPVGTETNRRAIWEENVKKIAKHNLEYDLGLHTYTVGLNKHADLTDAEFDAMRGYISTKNGHKYLSEYVQPAGVTYPTAVDWRKEGLVTPVKDQGDCGSCWAFSATGVLEGQHAKATGELVSLSEQNLNDCSKVNYGCEGGWPAQALFYVRNNGGINTEQSYPYTGKDSRCKYDRRDVAATVKNVYGLPEGDEEVLKSAIAVVGPISVAINSTGFGFNFYKSGVYFDSQCSPVLDHAVLAVGYGTSHGQDYWLVKNSWGTSWGDQGYIKMARNNNNQCGIASDTCYPTI